MDGWLAGSFSETESESRYPVLPVPFVESTDGGLINGRGWAAD